MERNTEPNGIALVNAKRVATKSYEELMELEEDRALVRQKKIYIYLVKYFDCSVD